MDTKELIESIITEDEETLNKFIETMDERVSDALEVRKVEIASGLIEAKMKDDDEDDDEDEDEDEDEDDEDEKSMKKEEVEQVDENVASSNDSKEIRRMIARQSRGGGDTLKGGLGARLGGEGRGEISRSNTVRGPTTRKGTLSKRVQRKLASVSKEGGRITGPKGKLPEEFEQVEEATGVTDYNPKSQGGTRDRLLQKFAKSGSPEHATAARKAGATQSELKAAMMKKEEVEQVDEVIGYRGSPDGYSGSPASIRAQYYDDAFKARQKKKRDAQRERNKKMTAKLPEEVEQDLEEAKFETRASWRTQTPEVISKNNKRIYDKMKGRDPEKAERFRLKYLVDRKKEAMAEEAEQIDELKAGTYAAVADARGNEWAADVNYEKSNYNPRKLKDVVRRAGKKFGPKVASQLSTMQGTREKRNDARFSDEDDKLAKPFPGYDGAKTTKSGMMHKTFGRVLKNQIKNRLNKEEAEQMDEADKLAGLDYNKGHKLMYKGGKQKIVKTAASQQAHRAMGWKERHSVRAAMKEQAADFDAKKDQERLDKLEKAMKTKEKPELSPAELAAMKEKGLKGKVGNVNVDFKSVTVREQSVAPGKRQSYERLPDGGMADPNFSKSVDAANKQKEMQMQQKLNAMKNQDAENEKNRPPKVQQEAAQLSDAQKLTLMRTKSPGMVRSALARYRKVGDVNKLSPAHRTLVAGYLEKAGGIDDLPRTVAAKLLKPKKQ